MKRLDLAPAAERITISLHDERRRLKQDEVLSAQRLGFVRRMKWIAEAHEPGDLASSVEVVRYHARDAAAHGFAADDDRFRMLAALLRDLAIRN